ncbi:hypothetical protein NEHOM01_0010 [Nematocida homosporus]|uniref:uncharacterized protein n=1 Tax=Nematocida homosporus TaxID=1912981 RepID=UPI00221E5635|nr:uncharacterized protein NEHOM01_0010 [Nematocida homosporus]KAI5184265.1 hypothetical protein NEHOM01_0010 [Nematocida homosporus]
MNFSPVVVGGERVEYPLEWMYGELMVSAESVFQLVRGIKDPEHDYSLEELRVVELERVVVDGLEVKIGIVPTIPHCSMVGLIGLSILFKLSRILNSRYLVKVQIEPGTHMLEEEVNKQLLDIERTFSAFINPAIQATLLELISAS